MKTARQETIIVTDLLMRGNGKSTPFRGVKQYWSLDGVLLAEDDPADTRISPEALEQMERDLATLLSGPTRPMNILAHLVKNCPLIIHG